MLVRTWNVFHGNASPPVRRAFLEEMVRLVTADEPDLVCLQELPVWSLRRLGQWSGMIALADVARRPMLGPFPSTADIGRGLTDLHHGLLRSAFTGQGNALLVSRAFSVQEHRSIALNPWTFRRREARRLRLDVRQRWKWGKERRACQVARLASAGDSFVVGNFHATGSGDRRLPAAEVVRAATFVDGFARPGEPVVLAGDFNLSVADSSVLLDLADPEWDLTGATPVGIDHVLARGMAGDVSVWPPQRRTVDGRVLSDHAPVERRLR